MNCGWKANLENSILYFHHKILYSVLYSAVLSPTFCQFHNKNFPFLAICAGSSYLSCSPSPSPPIQLLTPSNRTYSTFSTYWEPCVFLFDKGGPVFFYLNYVIWRAQFCQVFPHAQFLKYLPICNSSRKRDFLTFLKIKHLKHRNFHVFNDFEISVKLCQHWLSFSFKTTETSEQIFCGWKEVQGKETWKRKTNKGVCLMILKWQ